MLAAKITRFLADSATANFEELALEAFAYQFERIGPLRRLGEKHDAVPGKVAHWSDVPMVPTLAFKTLDLAAAPAEETFRSSGTSGGPRRGSGPRSKT